MIRSYMAIIYLGDSKENISPLTKARALASIPVGGSYRIIDFALSNVVNAGIRNVGLFCGNEELNSLTDHIGMGAEWDLARKKDGIFIFKRMLDDNFSLNQARISKNMEYFFRSTQQNIVVLNAHMVYNLENISLDAFVLSKELMLKLLVDSIQEGKYNVLSEIIARNLPSLNINAYEFKGYLQCINSTREYFDFNMNLLKSEIRDDVFGVKSGRKILTKVKDTPPTLFRETADVENSLVSNGCIIEGTVKNSILSRGAIIEKDVILEDCVILQDCHIKAGAHLKNVIVDKNNIIHENEKLSASKEYPLVIEKSMKWNTKQYQDLMDYIRNK